MKPPLITRRSISNHLYYHWWMYVLMIVACIVFWNLLYTVTAYRVPEDKRLDWYYQGYVTSQVQELTEDYLNSLKEGTLPDVEEFKLTQAGTDGDYGTMQLSVWMAGGQGDLYQLTESSFRGFAQDGEAFINLQPYIEDGTLDTRELRCFMVTGENGKKYPAGIYADELEGLSAIGLQSDGMVLGIVNACGNERNAVILLNTLLKDFLTKKE